MTTTPVLVITHAAYSRGLDAINRGDPCASSWALFHRYKAGERKLVVIDEALDVIEEAKMDLEEVKLTRSLFPEEVVCRHPKAIAALDSFIALLSQTVRREEQRATGQERIVVDEELSGLDPADIAPLRSALGDIRLDQKLTHRNDHLENRRLQDLHDRVLQNVQVVLDQWRWYRKSGTFHTINSARVIMPEAGCGAVILDATASSNLLYHLFEDRADLKTLPASARSYTNVKLHYSMGHKVGKNSLTENAVKEVPQFISALKECVGVDRNIFVCCHKDVEPHFLFYKYEFNTLEVGHWGAIDGRNDWQDCDTAVIFGLPYRDRASSANTFMAIQGVQTDEWLNENERPFGNYKDIRHAIEVGYLVVSIVQAINRIRCRRVIDDNGNCEPADVYLLLPRDSTGLAILEGIKKEMPGVITKEWEYAGARRRVRKSNHEAALVRYAEAMAPGRYTLRQIARALGIPEGTRKWLASRLRDANHQLQRQLAETGVRFEVTGSGRGAASYLVKA